MRKQIDELAKTLDRVGYSAYAHNLRNIFRNHTPTRVDNESFDDAETDTDDIDISIDDDLNDEDIEKVDRFIARLNKHKAGRHSNVLRKRLVTLRRRRR